MDIEVLTAWMRLRYEQLKAARDAGQNSTEVALIAGAFLVAAGLVIVAIKTKLAEKIGIINGG
ncbi:MULTISPECIES: hypothetical protein [unclassified Streptomyces]|uniref:hypothetical protein n=1 Tax=unclassified Streptomyces TaxID=2593676 RepID=UPI002E24B784|nr:MULTISPECIES: hypothetical protein [unclassified Streptomyces]WSV01828.1 hypothetical protein OG217_36930 [Streptomyces sp. NBC_01023]WSX47478.1 hypothetical protein OG760_37905 [Streptomyces sp. NBC_00963]